MTWCIQCGLQQPRIVEIAIGVDEEDAPACAVHATQASLKSKPAVDRPPFPLSELKEARVALCAEPGCNRKLRADNGTGLCREHRQKREYATRAGGKPRPYHRRTVPVPTPRPSSPSPFTRVVGVTASVDSTVAENDAIYDLVWSLLTPTERRRVIAGYVLTLNKERSR